MDLHATGGDIRYVFNNNINNISDEEWGSLVDNRLLSTNARDFKVCCDEGILWVHRENNGSLTIRNINFNIDRSTLDRITNIFSNTPGVGTITMNHYRLESFVHSGGIHSRLSHNNQPSQTDFQEIRSNHSVRANQIMPQEEVAHNQNPVESFLDSVDSCPELVYKLFAAMLDKLFGSTRTVNQEETSPEITGEPKYLSMNVNGKGAVLFLNEFPPKVRIGNSFEGTGTISVKVASLADIVKAVRKALNTSSCEYFNAEYTEGEKFFVKIQKNQIVSHNLPQRELAQIQSMLK